MRRWDLMPQETCFWRRRLFEAAGNVDRSYRFAMDYDLFVRMMAHGKLRRANRFLAAFRQHGSSKTTQQYFTLRGKEVRAIREKHRIPTLPQDEFFQNCSSISVYGAAQRFAHSA